MLTAVDIRYPDIGYDDICDATVIDIIVPVMMRPQNAEPFMQSLAESCDQRLVQVNAVVGSGDGATAAAWAAAGARIIPCHRQPGTFSQKVNIGYIVTGAKAPLGHDHPRKWLLLVGDDVKFHPGWLANAMAAVERTSEATVVGTNDLGNGAVTSGQHATHMLIKREYIDTLGSSWDGPGIVCHEGYRHCYVDDEIVHAAKHRGVWVAASDSIIEHMHPCWGKGVHDAVYAEGGAAMPGDGQLFGQRRSMYVG